MNHNLVKSNCLIQATITWCYHWDHAKIGMDFNSPNRGPSFYCDVTTHQGTERHRFRRKIRRHSNKGKLWFYGYKHIEVLKKVL